MFLLLPAAGTDRASRHAAGIVLPYRYPITCVCRSTSGLPASRGRVWWSWLLGGRGAWVGGLDFSLAIPRFGVVMIAGGILTGLTGERSVA